MNIIEIDNNNWAFNDPEQSASDLEILDEAIQLWRDDNYDLAESLLKNLITQKPLNIDALHHLSMLFDETSREVEAYLCCREAVRIGLDALTEKFDWKTSKLEWGILDNRPFMRAYHNLGLWHERRNEINSAIMVCSRLLSVCPNDNLGVRYLLPRLWLTKGDYLSIVRHCKKLEDDTAPEILYTYPLALFLMDEASKAVKLLKKAKQELPLVAKELRKIRHSKPKSNAMPGYITYGGEDQAYTYWQEYGNYWKGCERAMESL